MCMFMSQQNKKACFKILSLSQSAFRCVHIYYCTHLQKVYVHRSMYVHRCACIYVCVYISACISCDVWHLAYIKCIESSNSIHGVNIMSHRGWYLLLQEDSFDVISGIFEGQDMLVRITAHGSSIAGI